MRQGSKGTFGLSSDQLRYLVSKLQKGGGRERSDSWPCPHKWELACGVENLSLDSDIPYVLNYLWAEA